MEIYQVDAFTSCLFSGNPAAVVPLDEWLPDETLLAIAAENNLSETAFFVPHSGSDGDAGEGQADYHLRWFTPEVEVELCGHATLASAHVLFRHLGFGANTVRFSTWKAGELTASLADGLVTLDFPARSHDAIEVETPLVRALGRQPAEVYRSSYNLLCVFDNKREVHEIEPDAAAIKALDSFGVIATAPGASHDFVSRYFAPKAGVIEDPVTGSAHCSLAPFWAERLGKNRLTAHQVSKRGGELVCEFVPGNGEEAGRVRLSGHAVTYLVGEIRTGTPAAG